MGILNKFNDVSKGVNDKAKSISEANNLKRKILYEEERIVEIFTDIGKKYYKNPNEDPNVLKVLCDEKEKSVIFKDKNSRRFPAAVLLSV